jgi:hypothetical protein
LPDGTLKIVATGEKKDEAAWLVDRSRGTKRWGSTMDFDDLIRALPPPPNRLGKTDHDFEHQLCEGAVMVA